MRDLNIKLNSFEMHAAALTFRQKFFIYRARYLREKIEQLNNYFAGSVAL